MTTAEDITRQIAEIEAAMDQIGGQVAALIESLREIPDRDEQLLATADRLEARLAAGAERTS